MEQAMPKLPKEAKPLLRAVLTTVLALCAFAGLRAAGVATDLSLFGGLALAGGLNLASLAGGSADLLLATE